MSTYQTILTSCKDIVESEMKLHKEFPLNGHLDMASGAVRLAHRLLLKFKCFDKKDIDLLSDMIFKD